MTVGQVKLREWGTNEFYSLQINNPNDVKISSGSYGISGSMDILAGAFETNDSLTVISNALGTGRIGEITGTGITGEIVMERYIDAGETYWRYFSSAVKDPQIAQYNDDFITAGYPGSHFPGFGWVSIYTYDETLLDGAGYLPVSGASQVIELGQGLQVWCGDTITGTMPFTVDLRGDVNQGDIHLPVSYTFTDTPGEDGFCQVGNPYPSAIDWDAAGWTKVNMNNATYIQNPDNQLYATYIDGASANGGSRYIASQQAFWVEANAASPVLTITESCKSSNDPAFFKAAEMPDPGCNILIEGFDMADECVIRNREGTSDALEGNCDARKIWGAWGVNPQISFVNEQEFDLTVHTFDFGYEEWEIPLRVVVFENGSYSLVFNNIDELNVPCIKLEDEYTGEIYEVDEGVPLIFELSDTTYLPRFVLHIGKNYEQSELDNLCAFDATGQIILDLNEDEISYELHYGDEITTHTGFGDPIIISGLVAGEYKIEVPSLENNCGVNTFFFELDQPAPMNVEEIISHAVSGGDGSISLDVTGGTPPYDFFMEYR